MKCVILLALVAAAAASYSSGYASGSTALAPAIKQTSKFNIAATAFTGTTKTLIIKGYSQAIGILKADNKTFKDGCSCTATAARRASCTVTFSTIVPTTMAAATKTSATNLTPASLATAMAAAKAADTPLNAVTVPTASGIVAPTGGVVSAASSAATVGVTALALAPTGGVVS